MLSSKYRPNDDNRLMCECFSDFEKRAIRAAGEVQESLGCGVTFHPGKCDSLVFRVVSLIRTFYESAGRNPDAPFEIMRLYLEAGGNVDKCVMSHLDRKYTEGIQCSLFANLHTK